MITSITLTNFKCFRSQKIGLAALNVLTGTNGAGKSSVIHSLLALRQSWESDTLANGLIQLNGVLCELGTAGEVYCAEPETEYVGFSIASSKLNKELTFNSKYDETRTKEYFLHLDGEFNAELSQLELFMESFNYLHAERVGPRKTSPITPDGRRPFWVGRYGENAPFIVASDLRETELTNRSLFRESSDGKIYTKLRYQWPLWMAQLFPGFDGTSEIYFEADQVRLGLALQRKQTGQSLFVRPTNTGFGVSVVLGIIVAGLLATKDSVLIVENPEAHLHPRAQSCIGEFLARVASGGAQVFVETHSEHVLNGIRRMVKQETLQATQVSLHYFAGSQQSIEPTVTNIPLSSSGDISCWPDGFFDQLDQDLSIILG